jgi:hypothetical protein
MLINVGLLLLCFHDQLGMFIFYFSIAQGMNEYQTILKTYPFVIDFIYIYNILAVCLSGHPFHPSVPSFVSSSIHLSFSSRKKKMMEEEEEGGGRMVTAIYPNVYVIQYVFSEACS